MDFSERTLRLKPSATNAMATKAKELKATGRSVVSFTTGEPDIDSPEAARRGAIEAIQAGRTHYTVTGGVPELKKAVADYYRRHFHQEYGAGEILCGTGAKQLLFEAMGALVNPGDEVILFAPAWVSYYEQIRLFDGVPVVLDTRDAGFVPSPEAFERAITDRTKAVVLNNPNNPTGRVYPHDVLERIARVALERDITIINDEIYERLVYGGGSFTPHLLELVPEARGLVLNVNGVSKSFAMTGWRLGYALGPAALIRKMSAIQGHVTSNASSISQWAAVGALNSAEDDVEAMRVRFEARRDLAVKLLSGIEGLSFVRPEGAFYVFIDVSRYTGREPGKPFADDVAFCEAVLQEKGVGLVPGTAFLSPGYVRLSYSCAEEQIVEGVERLRAFVEALMA